jgi:hypothetical protein
MSKQVHDNRGDCTPVLNNDGTLVHPCERPEGGDKTIGAPQYELTIENPAVDPVISTIVRTTTQGRNRTTTQKQVRTVI